MPVDGILALDLATNLGWSLWQPGSEIESGHHRLPSTGSDIGKFLDAYHNWLSETLEPHGNWLTHVVFESPILPGTTQLATARKLYGLVGMTEWHCLRRGIKAMEVNNAQVRKEICGKARAYMPRGTPSPERKRANKAMVMASCADLGFNPENDDEADALLCLEYALRLFKLKGTNDGTADISGDGRLFA